jgi:hypothetical protein
MHRLVIGLTSLLALVGVGVIAFSLFLGAATTDRAARLAPADAVLYASVYLQPSTGQQAQLASVLSRLPGFEDRAALDTKIDELAQRFLGEAGIDYLTQVKPWLGNQVALAAREMNAAGQPTDMIVIADVKDADAALAAIGGLPGASGSTETTYQGIAVRTGADNAYAIVSGMLVLGQDEAVVHHAIDVAQGRAGALSAAPAFSDAMKTLPADRLATVWVDLRPTIEATASGTADTAGLSTLALALRAEEAGLGVVAQMPVEAGSAGAAVRDALAAGAQVAQLADAMPQDTEIAAMLFNLRATLQRAESEVKAQSPDVGATIDQLRGLAAFGLGINIDADLLPLLDGEVGLALRGVADQDPHGALLLRPTDAAAATAALDRISTALESRNLNIDRRDVAGTTVLTVEVPQVGSVSWADAGGLVVLGLSADDVATALQARDGAALDTVDRYRDAFAGGERGGAEVYVDLKTLMPLLLDMAGDSLPAESRDILAHVEAFGLTSPARDGRFEFHLTLTIR